MTSRHVVLVGLMGSGKTTVGAVLARRLGLPFSDGDALLEVATGHSAAALRDREGAAALHLAEARVLRDALASSAPAVIAAAAAVVDDPACRAALRAPGVAVAWLRADPAVLGRRFEAGVGGGGAHRPAYGEDPHAFLAAQARRRAARFAACRPLVVIDTGVLGPEEAAQRIEIAVGTARPGGAR
jgi:shikimate kinase